MPATTPTATDGASESSVIASIMMAPGGADDHAVDEGDHAGERQEELAAARMGPRASQALGGGRAANDRQVGLQPRSDIHVELAQAGDSLRVGDVLARDLSQPLEGDKPDERKRRQQDQREGVEGGPQLGHLADEGERDEAAR
jgi:hypothetical protein